MWILWTYYKKTNQHTNTVIRSKNWWEKRKGRPRTMWMDNIKDWLNICYKECIRNAENREKWGYITFNLLRADKPDDDDDQEVCHIYDLCKFEEEGRCSDHKDCSLLEISQRHQDYWHPDLFCKRQWPHNRVQEVKGKDRRETRFHQVGANWDMDNAAKDKYNTTESVTKESIHEVSLHRKSNNSDKKDGKQSKDKFFTSCKSHNTGQCPAKHVKCHPCSKVGILLMYVDLPTLTKVIVSKCKCWRGSRLQSSSASQVPSHQYLDLHPFTSWVQKSVLVFMTTWQCILDWLHWCHIWPSNSAGNLWLHSDITPQHATEIKITTFIRISMCPEDTNGKLNGLPLRSNAK